MKFIVKYVIAAAAVHQAVDAFAPTSRYRPRRQSVVTWSTVKSEGNIEKLAAVDGLEQLLERQKKDVEDTERLLRTLKSIENNEGKGELDDRTRNRALSFLSGFDYGFLSRSEGASFSGLSGGYPVANIESKGAAFEKYGPPANIVKLGFQQFWRNLNAIKGEYKDEEDIVLTEKQKMLQAKLSQLTLNSTAIWERELADGPIQAPLLILIPYNVLCWGLDVVFEGRNPFHRFFLLETVARMPYFSYITMLHLYETLGFWRRSSDVKRIHFAEEWNEFHHLLIMESLGGDQQWWVRFMSQHSALAYYIVLCFLWAISPTVSYKFSELLETHAVNTYGQFVDENEEALKELPPSVAAIQYYSFGGSDPFFGEYQTTALATGAEFRKPGENMQSLYDVFCAIREDEGDHVGTMKACLDPDVAVQSPSIERKILIGAGLLAAFTYAYSVGDNPEISSLSDLLDTAEIGANGLVETSWIDAAVAGVAGFASQFLQDEEEGNALGLAGDLFEAGAIGALIESARSAIADALVIIARFLAALL